jgi:hypothetical protein
VTATGKRTPTTERRSRRIDNGTPTACRHQIGPSAGMEGPFRVNLREGAFSIPASFHEIEIKCPIVASRHRGRPRNTQAILSSETETDGGWRIFTLSLIPASDRPPSNYSRKTRLGGSRQTSRSCRSFCRSRERHAVVVNRAVPILTLGSVFPSGVPFCARHWPFAHTPYAAQANGIDEPIPPIRPQIREIVLTRNPNLR